MWNESCLSFYLDKYNFITIWKINFEFKSSWYSPHSMLGFGGWENLIDGLLLTLPILDSIPHYSRMVKHIWILLSIANFHCTPHPPKPTIHCSHPRPKGIFIWGLVHSWEDILHNVKEEPCIRLSNGLWDMDDESPESSLGVNVWGYAGSWWACSFAPGTSSQGREE